MSQVARDGEPDDQRVRRLNTPSPGMEIVSDASGFPLGEVPAQSIPAQRLLEE